MSLRISGKNMDIGDSLRMSATTRIEDIVSKYFDGGYDGHITLFHEGDGFRADSVLHLDTGIVLRAGGTAGDATSAFEESAEHIEKRLRRYKRKLKNHHHQASAEADIVANYVLALPDEHDEVEEDYSPAIIAESTSGLRTLSVGEAVMELDLSSAEVIVFRHAGHNGVNVVYRRPDGNVGWVDPSA